MTSFLFFCIFLYFILMWFRSLTLVVKSCSVCLLCDFITCCYCFLATYDWHLAKNWVWIVSVLLLTNLNGYFMNCFVNFMNYKWYLVSVCAGLNLMNNVNCSLIAYFVGLVSSQVISHRSQVKSWLPCQRLHALQLCCDCLKLGVCRVTCRCFLVSD